MKWTKVPQTTASKYWKLITISSDGTTLAAVEYGGNVWTSSDGGKEWREGPKTTASKLWYSITSSSDGKTLAAVEKGAPVELRSQANAGSNVWIANLKIDWNATFAKAKPII